MSKKHQDADVNFISALADLLNEKDLAEIEVKRDYSDETSLNVRVSRAGNVMAAPQVVATAPVAAAPPPPAAASPDTSAAPNPEDDPSAVTSPMVGTAYLAPEPGKPVFVNIGDKVSEGQTILIVEAMKTMNQIPAPRAGTIKRILVDDGTPVEYGTPLVILE